MNTNTTTVTTTAEVKVRKSMTRDPKIAHKIASRRVMKRAWDIAENAFKDHCCDHLKIIAANTVAKSKTEFFQESLKLAWVEEKSGNVIHEKYTVPKKSLGSTMASYFNAVAENKTCFEIAKEVVKARYASVQTKVKVLVAEIEDVQYQLSDVKQYA